MLIELHQELINRDLCPNSKIGDQRDLTELDKYLGFLPGQAQRGEQSAEAKIVRLGDGWCLEITGPEELVRHIPEQLRHTSWYDGAIPLGSNMVVIRCALDLGSR